MMKELEIPYYGKLTLKNVIFDINGTVQFDGIIEDRLVDKFKELKKIYNVLLISSDTRGNLAELAMKLGVNYIRVSEQDIPNTEAKNNELLKLGKEVTIAIGNGINDSLMVKNAVLGIAIIGREGAATKTMTNADVVFPDPYSAIDFLLDDKKLIATLRA